MCQEHEDTVISKQIWSLSPSNCRKMCHDTERCSCIDCDHVTLCFQCLPLGRAIWVAILDPSIVETFKAISYSSQTSLRFSVEICLWWHSTGPVKDACKVCLLSDVIVLGNLHIITQGVGQIRLGGKWNTSRMLPQLSRWKRITWSAYVGMKGRGQMYRMLQKRGV